MTLNEIASFKTLFLVVVLCWKDKFCFFVKENLMMILLNWLVGWMAGWLAFSNAYMQSKCQADFLFWMEKKEVW